MESLFDGIRWIHIVVGFTGLVAFWIPAFARKGGTLHTRVGRVFEWAAYIVAGSATFNALGRGIHALADGATLEANRGEFGFLLFLAYLGIVTLASVRHAVRSVRVKADYGSLRTPFNFALAVLSIAGSLLVIAYALLVWSGVSIVLLALSPIGIGQGTQMISQMRTPPTERMGWYYAHLNNILGAGIAFHTAFLVFGSSRLVPFELPGIWQVVPWILPAAIGIPASRRLEARYRKKFGEPRRRRGASTAEGAPASV